MGQAKVGTLRFELFWAGSNPSPGDLRLVGLRRRRRRGRPQRRAGPAVRLQHPAPGSPATSTGAAAATAPARRSRRRQPAALGAWADVPRRAVERYGPERHVLGREPGDPEAADPRLAALERAELAQLLQAEAEGEGVREAARRPRTARSRASIPAAEIVLGGMFGTPLGGRKPGDLGLGLPREALPHQGREEDLRRRRAASLRAPSSSKVLAQIELIRDEMKDGGDAQRRPLDHRDRLGVRRARRTRSTAARRARPQRLTRGVQVLQEEAQQAQHPQRRLVLVARQLGRRRRPLRVVPEVGPVRRELRREARLGAFTKFTGGN